MTWYDTFLHQAADRLFALDMSFLAYPLVFAGGLLTNFCPCNVALVPMVIGCVGGFSRSRERGRALLYSAVFSAGIVSTFCLLGLLASVAGSFVASFRTVCLWGLAVVAVLMGCYCLGVFRFPLPGANRAQLQDRLAAGKRGGGLWGAFGLGLAAGVVAAPCTTPVLAVLLTYVAVQARGMYGVSLLFTYSLGFVVPLLLAGAFAGFLMGLQRLQDRTGYQQWIKRGSGAVLVLFALYLVKVAVG
jgi:cytochrome c-type biogenesis protein